ncbi:MAG: rRNA maturation RNase YbeY [Clostridia bacterium]|nr:rRNA maturation RNase YbeY [Clostridia bacterium]
MKAHRIYVKNEQDKEAYTPAMRSYIQAAIRDTLDYEEFEDLCEISVTLTDNEKIRALNAQYRNRDSETDVLSFPLLDGEYTEADMIDGYLPLGDIVISLEKAREQAKAADHNINVEVAFLCVHSTLHLLGYDHETSPEDEAEMFERQDHIMKRFEKRDD